jgi:hypothetical protein
MPDLTSDRRAMAEVIAVLLRRAGGRAEIALTEVPAHFRLLTAIDDGKLHIVLEEAPAPSLLYEHPVGRA